MYHPDHATWEAGEAADIGSRTRQAGRRSAAMTCPLTALAALMGLLFLMSCDAMVGAGFALGADQVAEEEEVGDGLF
jgi:hypothetical protein